MKGDRSSPQSRLRIISFLCLIGILGVELSGVRGQEKGADPQPVDQDATRFEIEGHRRQATALFQRNEIPQAIEAAKKALALETQVYAGQPLRLSTTANWIAQRYVQLGQFKTAHQWHQQALTYTADALGKEHWQVRNIDLQAQFALQLDKLSPLQRKHLSTANDLYRRALQLSQRNEFEGAITALTASHSIRNEVLGDDHYLVLETRHGLADLSKRSGDDQRAISHYQKTLAGRRSLLGEQHPQTGEARYGLAVSLGDVGRFGEAENLFQESLTLYTKLWGDSHRNTSQVERSLAELYRTYGEYEKARPLYEKVLAFERQQASPANTAVAKTLGAQGQLLHAVKDYDAARKAYRESLTIWRKAHGNQHPEVASMLAGIALTHLDDNSAKNAVPLLEECLEIRRRRLGEANAATVDAARDLARTYQALGEEEHAERCLQLVVQFAEELYGKKDWRTTDARYALSGYRQWRGLTAEQRKTVINLRQRREKAKSLDSDKAIEATRQVLSDYADILEHGSEDVLDTIAELAGYHAQQDDLDKAEGTYLELLRRYAAVFGDDHPKYGRCLRNYGWMFAIAGDQGSLPLLARQFLLRSKDIIEQSRGDQDAEYAECVVRLGYLSMMMKDYARSIEHLEQAARIQKRALGTYHVDYAVTLYNLGVLMTNAGDFELAENRLKESLRIRRRVLAEDDPGLSQNIRKVGETLMLKEENRQAIPFLADAIARNRKRGDPDAEFANNLKVLAMAYGSVGQLESATSLIEEAIRIWKKADARDDPRIPSALLDLSEILRAGRRFDESKQQCNLALELYQEVHSRESQQFATALEQIAYIHQSAGEFADAKKRYHEVLEVYETLHGKESPQFATALEKLAEIHQSAGEFAEAERRLIEALGIWKKIRSEPYPDVVNCMFLLGSHFRGTGSTLRARQMLKEVVEITRRTEGAAKPDLALTLVAYAKTRVFDMDGEEQLYTEALRITADHFGEENSNYSHMLLEYASFLVSHDRLEDAEKHVHRARDILRKQFGEESSEYIVVLESLGHLYFKQRRFAEAQTIYEQRRDLSNVVYGEQTIATSRAFHDLGRAYSAAQDYPRAVTAMTRSLTIREKLNGLSDLDVIRVKRDLAMALWRNGEGKEAERLQREAINRHRRELFQTSTTSWQHDAKSLGLRGQLDDYLSVALAVGNFEDAAFEQVVNTKGFVFLRQQQTRDNLKLPGNAERAAELLSIDSRIARLYLSRPDAKDSVEFARQSSAIRNTIDKLLAREAELESAIAKSNPSFFTAPKALSLDAIQAALPQHAALLEFVQYSRLTKTMKPPVEQHDREQRLLAFVVRSQGDVRVVDLGPAKRIEGFVKTWKSNYGYSAAGEKAARELRALIWDPIAPLVRDTRLVLASPNGVISEFPLAALPGKQQGTFLIEEHAIALIPAARDLPRIIARREAVGNGILLLGDVDYDVLDLNVPDFNEAGNLGEFSHRFPPLPGTRSEIDAIEKLYQQSFPNGQLTRLTKRDANESKIRQLCPQHRYVHLATHGLAPNRFGVSFPGEGGGDLGLFDSLFRLLGANPGVASGLVVAGGENPELGEEGLLTALEVKFMDLRGVDVAILSACETGRGLSPGREEGLQGMQQAFLTAGARTTITSYWKVDDHATRTLMVEFYRNLWEKKLSKIEAFRQAQIAMLRHYDPQTRSISRGVTREGVAALPNSPEMWAAFVLSGDWQ